MAVDGPIPIGSGGAPEAPAFDSKLVKIDVIGTLKAPGDIRWTKVVVEELELRMPKAMEDYRQAALMVVRNIRENGGLSLRADNENYTFYPMSEFERVDIRFRHVVGVTL